MTDNFPSGLIRPSAHDVSREFLRFGGGGAGGRRPCSRTGGRSVANQCAVRMSIALSRAKGQDILADYTGGALHSGACCTGGDPYPHITSAQTLFRHLRDVLGFQFERLSGGAAGITGRKGILFFDDVFVRSNGTAGDHIDFWNGSTYTNEATGTGAPTGNLPMFDDARRGVWFCQM
ncbi:MAG: hypothetical protein ACJAVR_000086 [Paracoccaceae bacterium]|jgi:hypothetical protein